MEPTTFSRSSTLPVTQIYITQSSDQETTLDHAQKESSVSDDVNNHGISSDNSPWTLSSEQNIDDDALKKVAPNLTHRQIKYLKYENNKILLGACKSRSCEIKYDIPNFSKYSTERKLEKYSTENLEKKMIELAIDYEQLKGYTETTEKVAFAMKVTLNSMESMMREADGIIHSRQKESVSFRLLRREVLDKGITNALSEQNLKVKDDCSGSVIELLIEYAKKEIPESLQKINNFVSDINASDNNFPLGCSGDLKQKTLRLWKDEAIEMVSKKFKSLILNHRGDLNPYLKEEVLPLY